MDDDNIDKYTVHVRFKSGDASEQVFNTVTEIDEDNDRIQFTDKNGKQQIFKGVSYHVEQE